MPRRLLLLAALPLALAGCRRDPPAAPPPKPPEVLVSAALSRKVVDYEFFTGRTEASERVDFKSRVTGHLVKAHFKEGTLVGKGKLLFEIDPAPIEAELNSAEATLAQAKARADRLEGDYKRNLPLSERGGIGVEEFQKIVGDRKEAIAAVNVAEAKVAGAKKQMEYTKIRAPFDGRISKRTVDPGNLVKAEETILATLVSVQPLYAMFDVDERTLLRQLLKTGALESARDDTVAIDIGLADEEGQFPHKGLVNFIDNRVDTGTGTMWMRGEFEKLPRPLIPGLFVRVRFPLGKEHYAVLVAEQAVGTDQGQKFVFVVDDKGKVEYRVVEVGRLHDGLREVKKGLKEGERIVVSGLQRVRGGGEVAAKDVPMPQRKSDGKGRDEQ